MPKNRKKWGSFERYKTVQFLKSRKKWGSFYKKRQKLGKSGAVFKKVGQN